MDLIFLSPISFCYHSTKLRYLIDAVMVRLQKIFFFSEFRKGYVAMPGNTMVNSE